MKHLYSLLFLLSLLLLTGPRGYGQQQPAAKTVTGNFTRVPFGQFVRELETQTKTSGAANRFQPAGLGITFTGESNAIGRVPTEIPAAWTHSLLEIARAWSSATYCERVLDIRLGLPKRKSTGKLKLVSTACPATVSGW